MKRSTLTWERMRAGELAPQNQLDQERVGALRSDDQDFLARHPFEATVTPRSGKTLRWTGWMGALTLAAALLVVVLPSGGGGGERTKGAASQLLVFHKVGEGSEQLTDRTRLGRGDVVQFAYETQVAVWMALYSVDGRGKVTVHFPLAEGTAQEVKAGAMELLPYSYQLDDAPRFENVVLVTSDRAYPVTALKPFLEAWSKGAAEAPSLPAEFKAITFHIIKKDVP